MASNLGFLSVFDPRILSSKFLKNPQFSSFRSKIDYPRVGQKTQPQKSPKFFFKIFNSILCNILVKKNDLKNFQKIFVFEIWAQKVSKNREKWPTQKV